MFESRLRLALAWRGREGGATSPCGDQHFVEESLPDLVDNNQMLEGSVRKIDACGSSERERRVAGKHVRVGVARCEGSRNVERGGVRKVLLHSREIRPDSHSGDNSACVLAPRP